MYFHILMQSMDLKDILLLDVLYQYSIFAIYNEKYILKMAHFLNFT